MRIAVAGGSGWIGGTIARELLERGHEVTVIGRDPAKLEAVEGATPLAIDVTDAIALAEAVGGHDAVVVAVTDRSTDDRSVIPAAARAAIQAVDSLPGGRLLYIGGGGTLHDAEGNRFVDSPDFPDAYKAEALAGAESLELFRGAPASLDWVYFSPPPHDLVPGDKQGGYAVAAGDDPVLDADGNSGITSGDMAAAAVDELEHPQFSRERFTVGYR